MKQALCFALALLCSCSPKQGARKPVSEPFHVLAGSELKDIETQFGPDIQKATGLKLDFTYSGTLDASKRLASGESFDALWVSHSKYIEMNNALKGKVLAQEKTMLSPVILGLKASKAKELGWDKADPTWKQIADASRDGKFTFGMTNPASSNTGLTAALGLAAALSNRPEDLTADDLKNPSLADFFHGQSLTSGSSGWLAEDYLQDQSRVDGIINYESVLLSLNAGGRLAEPLTLVYPKEGIITADYPLMLLSSAKRQDYNKLVAYIRSKDFQTQLSAKTFRRPINPDAPIAAAIPGRTLVELPFPRQEAQIDGLLKNFLASARNPGSSRYVLDLSGSMTGERLASLKEAMQTLASNSNTDDNARFQNREEVGIITFSSQTSPTRLFRMGSTPEQNAEARGEIERYVGPLRSEGGTAIYSSVQQALMELNTERSASKEKRYYSVVLMTDGENNRGMTATQFRQWYAAQDHSLRGIRVFAILFGEASADELQNLAAMTGGRVFDSRSKSLSSVFKEIRGYQ
jgi:Ca-activated chloride channel family protein